MNESIRNNIAHGLKCGPGTGLVIILTIICVQIAQMAGDD